MEYQMFKSLCLHILAILYIKLNFKFSMKHLMLYKPLLILFGLILLMNCNEKPKPAQTNINWVSEDPLSIPFRAREQKFEKGNLVWNNSFEAGRNLIVDSTGVTYRIDGWQKIGDNVEWVNIDADSIYSAHEAYDSSRAVKIYRRSADETDDRGEGVMSDFIRVIPGNYELTYYIRLSNIKPNRGRLGTRIFDAINIRLYFFDKNKIPIEAKIYDPYRNVFIDNSFKGFAFSNFIEIKELPWTKVIGKSCNIPYIDGDIPDEARYVKIFFGLKGTGTMWVDQVEFRYTEANFSFIERMQKLMDTTFLKQEIILPQPKQMNKLASIPYYDSIAKPNRDPLIYVPENPSYEIIQAANLIRSKIEGLIPRINPSQASSCNISISSNPDMDNLSNFRLIFSIGKTSLFKRFQDILPINEISGKAQGYFIYTTADMNNIVFLYGNEPAGNYYAASTAVQLFDNRKFIFHNARIIDYPDIQLRNIRFEPKTLMTDVSNRSLEYMILAKINGVYFNPGEFNIINNTSSEAITLKELPDYKSLLHYSLYLKAWHEKSGFTGIPGSENFSISDLVKRYLGSVQISNKIIIVPSDKVKYNTTQSNVNCNSVKHYAAIIRQIGTPDKVLIPRDKIGCFPVYQNNEQLDNSYGRAEACIDEMKRIIPEGIQYVWNGCSQYSYYTANPDIFRIISLTGTIPLWFDNSMAIPDEVYEFGDYPGKLNLVNLFRPFNNGEITELFNNIDTTQIFINFSPRSEIDIIRLISVSDFLWNPHNYHPEITLWKILQSRYGASCAKELVLFGDSYAKLFTLFAEIRNPVHQQRLIRMSDPLEEELEEHFKAIRSILGNEHPLVEELRMKSDKIKSEINAIEIK